LADLRTGKIVSKGVAFALPDGVNSTPLAFYQDAPALVSDDATSGYVRTCQGTKPGDSINPMYIDRIVTAATIAEAIDAYDDKRYADALKLYETALESPGGNQLRVHTGLYLTNLRLGKRPAAAKAFRQHRRPGPQFATHGREVPVQARHRRDVDAARLRPGALHPVADGNRRARRQARCLHGRGGPHQRHRCRADQRTPVAAARRDRQARNRQRAPKLQKKLTSAGAGSREMLVGSGRDDLSDALDRRVEFKVKGC
jgi:hypothetical protein